LAIADIASGSSNSAGCFDLIAVGSNEKNSFHAASYRCCVTLDFSRLVVRTSANAGKRQRLRYHDEQSKIRRRTLPSAFDNSVKSSTIRHTSQEKDSKNLVKRFEDQTKGLLEHFKSHQKTATELTLVINTSSQIDQLLHDFRQSHQLRLGQSKKLDWASWLMVYNLPTRHNFVKDSNNQERNIQMSRNRCQ
jgi:hypothetical protein